LIVRVAEIPMGEDSDSFVRREGKEAFEKRIAEARDFLIIDRARERLMSISPSFGARYNWPGALAETVSHVRDPLMRGESCQSERTVLDGGLEFQALVSNKKAASLFWLATLRSQAMAPARWRPRPGTRSPLLCILALRDETARDFLCQQNWREILGRSRMQDFSSYPRKRLRPATRLAERFAW